MNILLEYEYLTLQVKNKIKEKLRYLDEDSKLEFKNEHVRILKIMPI